MPRPIPLNCNDNAGTGFLLTDGKYTWLVTCIHTVTGIDPTISDKVTINSKSALLIVGTSIAIPIFKNNRLRLNFARYPDGCLVDALAINLTLAELRSLNSFGAYDLSKIAPAALGDNVVAAGFPGIQGAPIPATEISGTVEEVTTHDFCLDHASAEGISGGVVTRGTDLVGMVRGDKGTKPNLENLIAVNLSAVASVLFCRR